MNNLIGLYFFHGNPDAVACFQDMAFRDIDIKPQGIRIILSRVLGHEAVLVVIDICDKFYLRLKFQKFYHNKNSWLKSPLA